ncbi:hypothetical protein BFW25_19330 [Aeromonas caviae]|nr:hypothetical protein BFW25_19330 [Aeromonas caviae]
MAAAAVLYVLLPSGSVPYPVLLSAFVLSSLLGVLAHVPGGIGVFEASMSLLLTHYLPVDKLLASLLIYPPAPAKPCSAPSPPWFTPATR